MRNLVAAVVVGVLPGLASAQPAWQRLQDLRPGQAVTVYLRDGKVLKGKLHSVGAGGLSLLERGPRAAEVAREDVARVAKKSRLRGAMWGGIICFGIAAPVGAYAGPYIADWGNPHIGTRLRWAAGFGAFFGGIGAGIGALVGDETTVYKAGSSRRRPDSSAPGGPRSQ